MVLASPTFNASLGTILEIIVLTTIALTATGQLPDTINLSVQNGSVGYAKRKDTLLPTALLMMTGMTMMSLRTRNMLETESVTQGNKRGSVTVFPSFSTFLMDLSFLLPLMDTMSHGHPCNSL